MKKDFLAPVVVLSLVCLVVAGALALTNNVTGPVIAEAAKQREESVRAEILPEALDFELLEIEGLPFTVGEVYKSTNDVGYIITVAAGGYGGDVKIILGVTPDGKVIQTKVLEHSETKGLGSKITEPHYANQYIGIDKNNLDGVDAISGASISSRAYIRAVTDALEAFELALLTR